MNKKTYLIKARPGSFFMEIEKEKIENDLELSKTICFFVIEEKIGKKITATKYHIGEKYNLNRIKDEFSKDSSLYRNIKNNDYKYAIKYIPGNFGGVNKNDVCYTQKEIVKIIKDAKNDLCESF